MIKVKEFSDVMIHDSDDDCWYHSPDDKQMVEQINNFLEENPNIAVIDIKYFVLQDKNGGEDESRSLLIYRENPRKKYEMM